MYTTINNIHRIMRYPSFDRSIKNKEEVNARNDNVPLVEIK